MVTAYDNPALDGVYKLASINGNPTLKISENIEKITLPGSKKVMRYFNKDGSIYADGIMLKDEEWPTYIEHPYFPTKRTKVQDYVAQELLQKVVDKGTILVKPNTAVQSATYFKQQYQKLDPEYKRFDNPHVYKVGVSNALKSLRDNLITSNKR